MGYKSIIEKVEEERKEREIEARRRAELQRKIEYWKNRGYIVARLINAIRSDIKTAERFFLDFERDIRKLWDLTHKLNSMDIYGYPEEVRRIRMKLNDPDAVDEVERMINDLEKKIEMEKEEKIKREKMEEERIRKMRHLELEAKINAWEKEGYDVSPLKEKLDEEVELLENAVYMYEEDLRKLWDLKRRYYDVKEYLNISEDEIEGLFKNPLRIEEIEAIVSGLEIDAMKKRSIEEKRYYFQRTLEEYRSKNYNVKRLEEALEKDVEVAEKIFEDYERDVRRLHTLWQKLRKIDSSIFPDRWQTIRLKMNDPDRCAEIEKDIIDLEESIRRSIRERAAMDAHYLREGRKFISFVYSKIKSHPPDYIPIGKYVEKGNWEYGTSPDGYSTWGELSYGLLQKDYLILSCVFLRKLSRDTITKDSSWAGGERKYLIRCYVAPDIPEESEELVKAYTGAWYAPFIYDLKKKMLIYHKLNPRTALFSLYFIKEGKPPKFEDFIRGTADSIGVFTIKKSASMLNMKRDDLKKIIEKWEKEGKVIEISKSKEEYSFG